MSQWKIRYDVVRRMPDGDYGSVCFFPSDKQGFATSSRALEIMTLMEQADVSLGNAQHTYAIWPIAVHEEYGTMKFDQVTDAGDGTDGDAETNG